MCRFSSEAKATEVEVIRRGYVSPIIFRIQAIILEVHAPVKAKLHGFITLSRESNALVFFFKLGRTAVASESVKTPFLTKRSRSASLEAAKLVKPIRAAEIAVSCVNLYIFIVCMCLDVL